MSHLPSNSAGPIGPEALGQLLERHGAALALYARQLCAIPDDVVQETFIALAREPRAPESPVAWLFRCVRNRALTAARARRRRERHEMAAAEVRATWFAPAAETPLDGAAATAALAELPEGQREVIVARLWGGLTFAEIAELMKTSPSVVHRTYVSGLTALRQRLGAVNR